MFKLSPLFLVTAIAFSGVLTAPTFPVERNAATSYGPGKVEPFFEHPREVEPYSKVLTKPFYERPVEHLPTETPQFSGYLGKEEPRVVSPEVKGHEVQPVNPINPFEQFTVPVHHGDLPYPHITDPESYYARHSAPIPEKPFYSPTGSIKSPGSKELPKLENPESHDKFGGVVDVPHFSASPQNEFHHFLSPVYHSPKQVEQPYYSVPEPVEKPYFKVPRFEEEPVLKAPEPKEEPYHSPPHHLAEKPIYAPQEPYYPSPRSEEVQYYKPMEPYYSHPYHVEKPIYKPQEPYFSPPRRGEEPLFKPQEPFYPSPHHEHKPYAEVPIPEEKPHHHIVDPVEKPQLPYLGHKENPFNHITDPEPHHSIREHLVTPIFIPGEKSAPIIKSEEHKERSHEVINPHEVIVSPVKKEVNHYYKPTHPSPEIRSPVPTSHEKPVVSHEPIRHEKMPEVKPVENFVKNPVLPNPPIVSL
ncbi:hypothetical protein BY996DRAFT_6415183 [Phakopsora pachyrhizi]|nr:hypothetical protein BY996DRAFT_6415183 [Phakopsora pachyrhizi]